MSEKKFRQVKNFWEDQAKTHKASDLATAPDTYYRQFEIGQILTRLRDNSDILDIGCGNGYSTFHFAQALTRARLIGVDYSESMIHYAKKVLTKEAPKIRRRLRFEVGDVLKLSNLPSLKGKKFDYVVSERCIINLLDWDQQKKAILEMKKMLKPKGVIVLCENTQEGLNRLNVLRRQFGLKSIAVRWHNFYVPEKKLLPMVRKSFIVKEIKNIGSLYYIISRVVYAKLADLEGVEPRYLHPINKIASQLEPLGESSPNYIFLLQNKR